ncbi:MAG: hypothetical protein AB9866_18075 [Syntrophobacteraceae bacterium]
MQKMLEEKGSRAAAHRVGHRSRMRDHAVLIHKLLSEHRRISLVRIAEELETTVDTARRWVDSFSCIMPIRLERGVVIIDRGERESPKACPHR